MRRVALVLAVLSLFAATCTSGEVATTTTSSTTTLSSTITTSSTTSTTVVVPALGPPTGTFASFEVVPLIDDAIPYAGPNTPDTFDDVLVAPVLYDRVNDPELLGTMAANGFVVVPGDTRLFFEAYHFDEYDPQPLFVTTDAAYHVWHLAFDKVLRDTEQRVLLPILEEFVLDSLDAARAQRGQLAGTELEDPADRVVEWFQVAGALLGLDVGTLGRRAADEVALAAEAAQLTNSPITSFADCDPGIPNPQCIDYTLYRPRGHYNRTADLERYFRAMSHLGQSAFLLGVPESLRLGLLVSRVIVSDDALAERWALIYEPTAFLVGTADDYTPLEAEAAAGGLDEPATFTGLDDVEAVGNELLATRGVAINPEAASVRVMGARFVVDSYIYDQLTAPSVSNPDSEDARRISPLDLAAAFGSEFASAVLDGEGRTEPPWLHYDEQLARVQALLEAREADDWAATVYDAWLYSLEPMWSTHGAAFPDFMQSQAWTAKAHQTGFGSYTELKHDTILYAKQGFAVEGDFQPVLFEPRHWVEPDPAAFQRIHSVAALAQEGLDDRGLLDAEAERLLTDVGDFVAHLARIAQDELAGVPISESDNDWLEGIGTVIELLWLASSDLDPETGLAENVEDDEAALIADIFRTSFAVLELGTGRIDDIYVLVPNDEGVFQIARGGVYSYYEFWRDAAEGRLTDEEWRGMLAAGEAPARPAWQNAFLAGGAGTGELPEPEETFRGIPRGKFCRDLISSYSYADAHEYWEWEGKPDRMDADRNGIPCETVYPADEIARYLAGQ